MTAIAHYNLLERLGGSTSGDLYRARDTKVGRTVAFRLVRAAVFTRPDERAAFLEDARAAATLSHPNIATLFDVGEDDADCYLVYEFAAGITLRQENAGRALNPRRAVELAVQIADALSDGHAHGVLHGDLRPDTIIVTHKGSAKVLEFGMSRWTTGGRIRGRAAGAADSLGSEALPVVSYMSPEQVLGGPIDSRTDVFSLGIVLYEMLTGRNPFTSATAADTVVNVIRASIAPSHVLSTASTDLDALVTRALAKEIDKRPQSAASFSAELRGIGAILDVRSGDASPSDLLPLDDEGGGGGKWWAAAVALAAIVAVAWWIFR